MSVAVANPDEITLKRYLVYSLFLHGALAAAITASIIFHFMGNQWGSVGGASEGNVKVNLVSSVGLPMPKPPEFTESKTFDPTDSLYKPQQPKPPEPPKPEIKVPEFKNEKPPKPIEHKSRIYENPAPPPPNAVPGHGGVPNIPTGYQQTPGASSTGVAIAGQGAGDFATRYGWYVEAVKRLINQNWLQTTIDPAVRAARQAHCVVTFTINRDGSVKNIQLTQTSGNLSMDNSAKRALLSIDHMPPLPSDYSGSYVNVTFDFDLSMTR